MGAADSDPEGRGPASWVRATVLLAFGVEMGVAVWGGHALGAWADEHLETAPWLMLIGVLLGIAAAGASLVTMLTRLRARSAGALEEGSGEGERPDDQRSRDV